MSRHFRRAILLVLALAPTTARAGMPSVTLTDVALLRFETISFFLVGLLASAGVVQLLWNLLRADSPHWPRLTYPRACAAVVLWGLLFVVVLTMISGARELLTPGAWHKEGLTYRLAEAPAAATDPAPRAEQLAQHNERHAQLDRLGVLLREYARRHEGRFPSDPAEAELEPLRWRLPGVAELRYVYLPGRTLTDLDAPLAYEPNAHGDEVLVLYVGGAIRSLPFDALAPPPAEEPGDKTVDEPVDEPVDVTGDQP